MTIEMPTPVLTADNVMITWSIESLGTKPNLDGLTDAVVTIGWKLKGEQLKAAGSTESYVSTQSGTINVTPNAANFIPYNQLTQTQIVNWVNTALGHTKTQSLIKQIIGNIEYQKNPIVNKAVPWN